MVRSLWYWDASLNLVAGCLPVSPGCGNCFAPFRAGTLLQQSGAARDEIKLYVDTTKLANGRPVHSGHATALPPGDEKWTWALRWGGASEPVMGPGKPSVIFVCDMSDLFYERHSTEIIDRILSTIALSSHIGLVLTRRVHRMCEYFLAVERSRSPEALRRWQSHLWLGFSAEDQKWFDLRWPPIRRLADRGWTVFCSLAPMLGPVKLPSDFLSLGDRAWCICSGEQRAGRPPRYMDPNWPRAVCDQCAEANVPFFMKQMSGKKAIPPDLHVWELPPVCME